MIKDQSKQCKLDVKFISMFVVFRRRMYDQLRDKYEGVDEFIIQPIVISEQFIGA